jgi:anti-sigma regulatory factor (Ser/Thr protein kinase)
MSPAAAECAAKVVTDLPADPQAPRTGRIAVRSLLPPGDTADTAELLISELMTNAIQESAPGETISLWLELARGELFIGVIDSAAGIPSARVAHPDDEDGRGLAIVETLSKSSGYMSLPGGRKCVYCTIVAETA